MSLPGHVSMVGLEREISSFASFYVPHSTVPKTHGHSINVPQEFLLNVY